MYPSPLLIGTVLLQGLVAAHGDSHSSSEMGPAAFMWPEDRPWSADADNTPPCGSSSGVGERTEFPLTNGRLALVTQDDTRAVHVGVSYDNDPQSITDFEIFYGPQAVGGLDIGHTCITAPDPPTNISAGSNATFMFFYLSEDTNSKEAFYACTDITYVETTAFAERIPCFNATREEPGVSTDAAVDVITTAPDGSDPHPDEDHGLSRGTIAGAVVGSVLGALAIAALAFLLFRRSKKSKAVQQPAMAQTKDVERAESDTSSR
ncbi:hypothetical protein M409DRAFT_20369 [Zasmidium cellare ATCC 36951]|uniref:Copper acquisition factor BIM1-like domain-containing protein n=1 Tax=Zasmidium cellare ATCC 36951 TaxID=1080233 RepID=A0A6A6CR29_ZASCE|nr:uncharacterized protein M409DRAFT_20369 [Zasmidium cellare ATCC 36951]KAF2169143.1 hypothetical protein M409DRAFT_20369 [Zasmidium cellare ATCC 36951]